MSCDSKFVGEKKMGGIHIKAVDRLCSGKSFILQKINVSLNFNLCISPKNAREKNEITSADVNQRQVA